MSTNYYPLHEGWTYYYASVNFGEVVPSVVRLERRIESVARQGDSTLARVSVREGLAPPRIEEVRLTPAGVWVDGLLEIKLPARENDEWNVEDRHFLRRVLSLDAQTPGVSRKFYYEHCLEVGAGNTDTDSASKFYSPGLGLVREDWEGESRNETLVLLYIKKPDQPGG